MDPCAFDKLFCKNVPHILEKIFFSLDYESYEESLKVCKTWNELLKSKAFQKTANLWFREVVEKNGRKLWHASGAGNKYRVGPIL